MGYEKDQHPSAKIARQISIWTMVIVTVAVAALYGFFFDNFSETELMQLSFLWISLMGFGVGGLILAHKGVGASVGIGLVIALAFFLGLQTFFWLIWPSL